MSKIVRITDEVWEKIREQRGFNGCIDADDVIRLWAEITPKPKK